LRIFFKQTVSCSYFPEFHLFRFPPASLSLAPPSSCPHFLPSIHKISALKDQMLPHDCGRCRAACCVRLRSIKLPHVIPHPFTPALQWVAGGDKNLHAEKKRGVHPTFKTYQKLVPKYGITWRFFQPSLKELPNYKEKKNFLKTIFRLLGPFGGKGVLSFPGFFSRLHLHLVSKLEMSTSRGNPLYLEGNVKAFNLVPQIFDTSNGFQNHWEIFKASYYFLKINVF